MFGPTLRLFEQQQPTPYIYTNPYKAKKAWPPNLQELSQIQQFRLERRYRRRSKLKWARPGWTKGVKIVQMGLVTFVMVYGVLFLDWKQEDAPFEGIRKSFDNMTGNIWTRAPSESDRTKNNTSPVAASTQK